MHSQSFFITVAALASTAPVTAFWRMGCGGVLDLERADPIVNPGAISGHVHNIVGGSAFDFTMDYAKTQTSACTSCEIKKDLSNYWTPSLYFQETDGTFTAVRGGGTTVYYLQRPGRNDKDKLKAFPPGFRMLAGDPFKRASTGDFASKAVSFVCLGGTQNEQGGLPTQNCPQGLRAQIFFPSCWDGVNLDSADHKSHMSYPIDGNYNGGNCPSTHPVHLISIFFEVTWSVNDFKDKWAGRDQPFVFAMGDPTGYGFHGDFLNGWDVDYLQKAIDTCTSNSGSTKDCPIFNGGLQDGGAQSQCRISPKVTELVTGTLPAMPGCNPVQKGPNRAVKATDCTAPTTPISIGQGDPGFADMTSKGWAFQGCATDNYYSRSLSGFHNGNKAMTVELCAQTCSDKGYSLAGLEYASECWCGNTLLAGRQPTAGIMGNCQMKCAGNSTQYCGGAGAMSLYKKCTDASSCKNAGASSGGSSSAAPSSAAPSSAAPSSSSKPSSSAAPSSSSKATMPQRNDPAVSSTMGPGKPTGTASATTTSSAAVSTTPSGSSSATASPTSSPVSEGPKVEGLPTGWKSTGCYVDELNPRSLPEWGYYGKPNTNGGCATSCSNRGFKYAGTENSGQCFCGNAITSKKVADSECKSPCPGNNKEMCGGPARLSVFVKDTVQRSMRIRRRRAV